ncbi:hypothetical protein [Heliobacterium mobile]|nr:hypothetical protein [Heliobacterium mobile]
MIGDTYRDAFLALYCEAFASDPSLYPYIDKLYEKNKLLYYQKASQHKAYTHPLLVRQKLEKEIYAKRMLGIIIAGKNDEITSLVKQGWPLIYSKVSTASQLIDMEAIVKAHIRYIKDTAEMTDDEFLGLCFIIMFTADLLKKPIEENEFYKEIFTAMLSPICEFDSARRFSFKAEDVQRKACDLKQRVFLKYKLTGFPVFSLVGTNDEFLKGIFLCFVELFNIEGLSWSIIEEEITVDDFEDIFAVYIRKFKNQNRDDAAKFFYSAIMLKGLLKAYRSVKESFFQNNKETLYLEMDTLQTKVKELEVRLTEQTQTNEKLRITVRKLEAEVKNEYNRAVSEYRSELQKLQKERDELKELVEKNQKELRALREFVFRLEQGADEPESNERPDLSSVRGIVIGGHDRWQQRLKTHLSHWRFIGVDQSNFDVSILEHADAVFFNVRYLCHKMYEKSISVLRRSATRIGYVQATNDTQAFQEIARQLFQKRLNS